MTSSDNAIIVNPVQEDIDLPELDNPELFVERLEYQLSKMATSINSKEGGLYSLNEVGSFQKYFNTDNPQEFKNVYRKAFDFIQLNSGNIDASEQAFFPHGMSGVKNSAFIYANCTSGSGIKFSVVYPDVWIDDSTVYFTNPLTEQLTQVDVIVNVTKES